MFNLGLEGIVIALPVVIIFFFTFRFVVLWYWKVDRMVELLEKIEKNTGKDNKF